MWVSKNRLSLFFPIRHCSCKPGMVCGHHGAYVKTVQKLTVIFEAIFNKDFHPGRMDGDKAIVPADFLLKENNTIQTVFYGADIEDHIPLKIIEEFI